MTAKVKKIIDIIELIIIIALVIICVFIYNNKKGNVEQQDTVFEDETVYTKIYESQKIETLKKKNEELYAEIERMKDVESALKIKYKYKYFTDTIYVPSEYNTADSLYYYKDDNDTISYELYINATNLKWHKTNFEINDNFTIINKKTDDNTNTLLLKHSDNVSIVNVDAWNKKTTFKDHIFYGPSIGLGYGIFNNKIDVYVGFSVGYKF